MEIDRAELEYYYSLCEFESGNLPALIINTEISRKIFGEENFSIIVGDKNKIYL